MYQYELNTCQPTTPKNINFNLTYISLHSYQRIIYTNPSHVSVWEENIQERNILLFIKR